MILHKGNYNGKQLVPESYMKMATSNLVDNSVAGSPGNLYSGFGYGYQFVMNPEPVPIDPMEIMVSSVWRFLTRMQ